MSRISRHWKIVAVIALLLVGGGAWRLGSNQRAGSLTADSSPATDVAGIAGEEPSANALPVRVLRLGSVTAPRRADDYRGTIQPSKSVELSFRRSGLLQSIAVEEGAVVTAGERLAVLDSGELEAQLRGYESQVAEARAMLAEMESGPREETIQAARAELQERKAAMELANLTLERERRLQSSSASTEQAFDEARTAAARFAAGHQAALERLKELEAGTRAEQLAAQRARVQSLNSAGEVLQVQLRDCAIVAPFDGVVARRFVDEGIIAGPERQILRLMQIDPLEARFGVSAEDAARLNPGEPVSVTVAGEPVAATVSRIEPDLDLETRTQGIHVSIPNRSGSRRVVPGQTASLAVRGPVAESDDGYWLPIQALSRSVRGLWSVFVVVPDDRGIYRVERRDVQVAAADAGMVLITGGMVERNAMVVSDGLHRITPGMSVVPVVAPEMGDKDAGRE